ncbi:hypothetical protein GW17_00021778 [Ensete ventricosum]|nr:hypothetical protein GW17_00021778 [Ensete ventricosum]
MNQGFQFRPIPPGTGGTYWSARLSGGTVKNRHRRSIEGEIDCRRSIEGEIDRRRSIEEEKGKEEEKKKKIREERIPRCPRPRVVRAPSPRAVRKIEATLPRSFDQPWRDATSEPTEINQMEEEQACRSLLVIFSTALAGKQSGFPVLSYLDLEKSGLFEWERCSYHNKKWNKEVVL